MATLCSQQQIWSVFARRRGLAARRLQKNVLDRQRWPGREQLRLAIVTWIERTYHLRRRQQGLGRLIEYETINRPARVT